MKRLLHSRILVCSLCAVAALVLACALAWPSPGASQPFEMALPIWFGRSLIVKSGPEASCATRTMCMIISSLPRAGRSVWIVTTRPDGAEIDWQRLLFIPD